MDFHANFNKKYSFSKNENYKLPPVDLFYSTDGEVYEELEKIKVNLNEEKSRLNHFKIEGKN